MRHDTVQSAISTVLPIIECDKARCATPARPSEERNHEPSPHELYRKAPRRLALKANPDRLEAKHTITEPINVMALATGALRGLAQIGIMQTDSIGRAMGAVAPPSATSLSRPSPNLQALDAGASSVPITAPVQDPPSGAGGSAPVEDPTANSGLPRPVQSDGALAAFAGTASGSAQTISLSAPWVPASSITGGGALPPRGGSGGPSAGLIAAATPGSGGSAKAARAGLVVRGFRRPSRRWAWAPRRNRRLPVRLGLTSAAMRWPPACTVARAKRRSR